MQEAALSKALPIARLSLISFGRTVSTRSPKRSSTIHQADRYRRPGQAVRKVRLRNASFSDDTDCAQTQ
jgi:hypothetical protein